jgi:hypothetical protein
MVLWLYGTTPYFYFEFSLLLLSIVSCVCQYVYHEQYRYQLMQRRIRLAEHWHSSNYIHAIDVGIAEDSESKESLDQMVTSPKQAAAAASFPWSNDRYSLDQRIREAVVSLSYLGIGQSKEKRNQLLDLLIELFENEGRMKAADITRLSIAIERTLAAQTIEYYIIRLYVPQVTTFLALSKTSKLVRTMEGSLTKVSVSFTSVSHRMYWYLSSFFGLSEEPALSATFQRLLKFIDNNGELAMLAVASGHADELLESLPELSIQKPKTPDSKASREFQSTARKNFLQGAVKYFSTFRGKEEEKSPAHAHEEEELSPSSEPNHNSDPTEHVQYRSYPLFRAVLPPECSTSRPLYFKHAVQFWEALCEMSTLIFQSPQPREERTGLLKEKLREFVPSYLPSSCIYAPIGHDQHRIYSIIIDDCKAFSTVSRAPLLICLEIVDYVPQKRRDRSQLSWWKRSKRVIRESMNSIVEKGSSLASELGSEQLPSSYSRKLSHSSIMESKRSSEEKHDDYDKHLTLELLEAHHESTPIAESSTRSVYGSMDINPLSLSSAAGSGDSLMVSQERGQPIVFPSANQSHRNQNASLKVSPFASDDQLSASNIGMRSRPSHQQLAVDDDDAERSPSDKYQILKKPILHRTDECPDDLSRMNERQSNARAGLSAGSINVSDGNHPEEDRSPHRRQLFEDTSPKKRSSSDVVANESLSIDEIFKETWYQKEQRVRAESAVGSCSGWRLLPVIVKSLDDLRQEQMISQLLFIIDEILDRRGVDCWLRPYDIISIGKHSGIIEAVPDTISLDGLKKKFKDYTSLNDFFSRFFQPTSRRSLFARRSRVDTSESDTIIPSLAEAKENFMRSLAGYSIACYLLQIKDRHNGNILVDIYGHIIHIDFGFVLGIGPGNITFESAPFKLTSEMLEVLGGNQGPLFHRFRSLCIRAFLALRRDHRYLVSTLDMIAHVASDIPCFPNNDADRVVEEFRKRFVLDLSDQEAAMFMHELIDESIDSWTTTCFDRYERCCVGIL